MTRGKIALSLSLEEEKVFLSACSFFHGGKDT